MSIIGQEANITAGVASIALNTLYDLILSCYLIIYFKLFPKLYPEKYGRAPTLCFKMNNHLYIRKEHCFSNGSLDVHIRQNVQGCQGDIS